jgi:adenylate cyclase
MGTEIERRFLVLVDKLPDDLREAHSSIVEQTYLSTDPWVRIRIYRGNRDRAVLTVKGKGTIRRPETNCEIPVDKATEMWSFGKHEIRKIRHEYGRWEIDEFTDQHTGLWMAEIELSSEDEQFDRPEWLGEEVTEDIRYTNAFLAEHGLPDKQPFPTAHYIK